MLLEPGNRALVVAESILVLAVDFLVDFFGFDKYSEFLYEYKD